MTWRARALVLCHVGTINGLLANAGISGSPRINLLQAFDGMRAKSHVLGRVCGKCVWLQGSTGSSGCLEQTWRQSTDSPRDPWASCPGALVCSWLMSCGRLFISQHYATSASDVCIPCMKNGARRAVQVFRQDGAIAINQLKWCVFQNTNPTQYNRPDC